MPSGLGSAFAIHLIIADRSIPVARELPVKAVARAIEHHKLVCESRRLAQSEKHRQAQEQLDAERLLDEQRLMLGNLDSTSCSQTALDPALTTHYRELLRAQVIMGSGNLHDELGRLAEVLLAADASARRFVNPMRSAMGARGSRTSS